MFKISCSRTINTMLESCTLLLCLPYSLKRSNHFLTHPQNDIKKICMHQKESIWFFSFLVLCIHILYSAKVELKISAGFILWPATNPSDWILSSISYRARNWKDPTDLGSATAQQWVPCSLYSLLYSSPGCPPMLPHSKHLPWISKHLILAHG